MRKEKRKTTTTIGQVWILQSHSGLRRIAESGPSGSLSLHGVPMTSLGPISWLCVPPNSALTITIPRFMQALNFSASPVSIYRMPSNADSHEQKPKFSASPWNTLAVSTEFLASVSADSVLRVTRAMNLGPDGLENSKSPAFSTGSWYQKRIEYKVLVLVLFNVLQDSAAIHHRSSSTKTLWLCSLFYCLNPTHIVPKSCTIQYGDQAFSHIAPVLWYKPRDSVTFTLSTHFNSS